MYAEDRIVREVVEIAHLPAPVVFAHVLAKIATGVYWPGAWLC